MKLSKKSQIIRVGCDIVNLKRFKKVLARTRTMSRRIFLFSEEKEASLEKLAGIFAAKEATIKALELKAGDWKKIEVVKNEDGRPEIKLLESDKEIVSQDISISHDGQYVMAVAVFLMNSSDKQ